MGWSPATGLVPGWRRAEENLARRHLANVTFQHEAAEGLPAGPAFDLVLTFDCLHDMPHPDRAPVPGPPLAAVRVPAWAVMRARAMVSPIPDPPWARSRALSAR